MYRHAATTASNSSASRGKPLLVSIQHSSGTTLAGQGRLSQLPSEILATIFEDIFRGLRLKWCPLWGYIAPYGTNVLPLNRRLSKDAFRAFHATVGCTVCPESPPFCKSLDPSRNLTMGLWYRSNNHLFCPFAKFRSVVLKISAKRDHRDPVSWFP